MYFFATRSTSDESDEPTTRGSISLQMPLSLTLKLVDMNPIFF